MNEYKDNSNLDDIFIGENPSPKSERPQFKNQTANMKIWSKDIPDKEYKYKIMGWLYAHDISNLLLEVKTEYDNIEMHVSPSTCALVYRNHINDNLLMLNLKLVCEEDEICQALSDINGGAFDLKNKKFWINSNESIDIVINKSVEKGYSYIVSNNEVVGICEHSGI